MLIAHRTMFLATFVIRLVDARQSRLGATSRA